VRAPGRIISDVLFALSCVLFAVCLFNDGYFVESGGAKTTAPGFLLLLIGWISLSQGVVAWLANPLLLVGWQLLALRRVYAAAACAFTATVCAGSFLFRKTILTDAGGNHSSITGFGLGYWLWLASAAALFAASIVAVIESQNHNGLESSKIDVPAVSKKPGAQESGFAQ
jgi:hypothetical protein